MSKRTFSNTCCIIGLFLICTLVSSFRSMGTFKTRPDLLNALAKSIFEF